MIAIILLVLVILEIYDFKKYIICTAYDLDENICNFN